MIKKFTTSLYFYGYRLVILSLLLFSACQSKTDANKKIAIRWENDRAKALVISNFPTTASSEKKDRIQVKLSGNSQNPAIFGSFTQYQDSVVFEPLIPFTRGMQYDIFINQKLFGSITIPTTDNSPSLLAIFPSQDTVPENLLKLYFEFSQPMTEEKALQHIFLTDMKGDTIPNVFLELHPELWNEDNTILTLWLDPGRIKRDLQPNKRLGLPLIAGKQYKMVIAKGWEDKLGAKSEQVYTKTFWVTHRDEQYPETSTWQLDIPAVNTQKSLKIHFKEAMDYILLKNTIQITDANGNIVLGKVEIEDEEKIYSFTPDKPWTEKKYKIKTEARLEDLAGNNLNRLFDTDLQRNKSSEAKNFYEIVWQPKK
jgi:hypothetical protein